MKTRRLKSSIAYGVNKYLVGKNYAEVKKNDLFI